MEIATLKRSTGHLLVKFLRFEEWSMPVAQIILLITGVNDVYFVVRANASEERVTLHEKSRCICD